MYRTTVQYRCRILFSVSIPLVIHGPILMLQIHLLRSLPPLPEGDRSIEIPSTRCEQAASVATFCSAIQSRFWSDNILGDVIQVPIIGFALFQNTYTIVDKLYNNAASKQARERWSRHLCAKAIPTVVLVATTVPFLDSNACKDTLDTSDYVTFATASSILPTNSYPWFCKVQSTSASNPTSETRSIRPAKRADSTYRSTFSGVVNCESQSFQHKSRVAVEYLQQESKRREICSAAQDTARIAGNRQPKLPSKQCGHS